MVVKNKRHLSKEHRLKISLANKGKINNYSEDYKNELRKRIEKYRIKEGYWLGKKMSEETKNKLRVKKGKKAYNWTGINASYAIVHMWLKKEFGKANRCENNKCFYPKINSKNKIIKRPSRFEWALIKGKKYQRRRENFFMLCPSCHRKYDMQG